MQASAAGAENSAAGCPMLPFARDGPRIFLLPGILLIVSLPLSKSSELADDIDDPPLEIL